MKIDFVMPWVDGGDENWIREKNKYSGMEDVNIDDDVARYRDWDILRYWFRSIEKFAPWVNKVFFITCGQKPEWLNEEHEKLVLVDHKDYIPNEYLPTFSSHPIELNMHRIKGLSEHFVYFNDDVFLTGSVEETDFFRKGLPCDLAMESPITPVNREIFKYILCNNMVLLNEHFNRREVLKKQGKKFYFVPDKKTMFVNWSLRMLRRTEFFGLEYAHLPVAYCKSTFEEVWKQSFRWLDETSRNKFRSANDVNQFVFKNHQIVTGKFTPYNWRKTGKAIHLDDRNTEKNNIKSACDSIISGRYKMLCLNDANIEHFDETKKQITEALERLLPEKSRFER